MRLCGFHVLLKCGRMLELKGGQRGFERGQVFVGFQPTESLGCFHHGSSGPTQHHGRISPSAGTSPTPPPRPVCGTNLPVEEPSTVANPALTEHVPWGELERVRSW